MVVVGAGFAGSVCARRMAEDFGQRVLVIDRRPHIAGNAHDIVDQHGVLCHTYGAHVFHTNAPRVTRFLSRFTAWRPYRHRVLAEVDGRFVPLPINRITVQALHGVTLRSGAEMTAYLSLLAESRTQVKTSEDAVVAKVGRDLYERLFRGYTRKQWALDPSELDASVCARIPVRTNADDRYFGDVFQQMPLDGFTAMFEHMLEHPNIEIRLGIDYEAIRDCVTSPQLVWTGPIDAFFDHRLGKLPYRSLTFERETRTTPGGRLAQPVAVVNYPNERIPYTRVAEFRHLSGQVAELSTLAYEFPAADGDPYYPIPRPENRALYHRYAALASSLGDVLFVGRLARYQYLNMDQVVAAALVAVDRWAVSRSLAPCVPKAA